MRYSRHILVHITDCATQLSVHQHEGSTRQLRQKQWILLDWPNLILWSLLKPRAPKGIDPPASLSKSHKFFWFIHLLINPDRRPKSTPSSPESRWSGIFIITALSKHLVSRKIRGIKTLFQKVHIGNTTMSLANSFGILRRRFPRENPLGPRYCCYLQASTCPMTLGPPYMRELILCPQPGNATGVMRRYPWSTFAHELNGRVLSLTFFCCTDSITAHFSYHQRVVSSSFLPGSKKRFGHCELQTRRMTLCLCPTNMA